jgi:arylformamidase
MKIFDISVTIKPGMPVWPGDDPVDLHRQAKIEEGANANVSFLGLSVHTGTHVDAPYHFLQSGTSVDQMPLEILIGPVQVVEIPSSAIEINADVLRAVHFAPSVPRVLFKTSNSDLWAKKAEAFQTGFVGITKDGAEVLVEKSVRLVGIDYLSIAPYKKSRPTHEVLLGAKMVVIEGVNLVNVKPGLYTLYCLPLKLAGADGAPARTILVQD